MFDNRWDNWSSDFAESVAAGEFSPAVRDSIPLVLEQFGAEVRKLDPDFPDEVSAGTFATVLSDRLTRLSLPQEVRVQVPEIIAVFLENLQVTGRLGEGRDWAAQVRVIGKSVHDRIKPDGSVKGVTVRRPEGTSAVGRNDPCPCGSGKKFKKCCGAR